MSVKGGLNPLPDDKIVDRSNLKQSEDDNFKFDENSRKQCYEQFLFFPRCFLKACFLGASEGVIVWEWVKSLPNSNSFDRSILKAFADDKINVIEKLKFSFGR